MRTLRRRLHGWVIAWMTFQVVSLSALVPRDCCEAHAHKATMASSHDHTSAHCPMRAVDGKPCQMHEAPANHHDHGTVPQESQATPTGEDCVMRGSCDGPTAGFIALLSHAGVLTEAPSLPVDLDMRPSVVRVVEQVVSRLESPDSPPPRA
jgi:hypothetical protein